MSNLALNLVWERSRAKATRRLVLVALADRMNEKLECWPSVADIAKRCGINARYVQLILNELVESGELVRESRPGKKGNSTNLYRLTLAGVNPASPLNPASPHGCSPFHPPPESRFTPGVNPASPGTLSEPQIEPPKECVYSAPSAQTNTPSFAAKEDDTPYAVIIDRWQQICPDFPQPQMLTAKKRALLRAFWKRVNNRTADPDQWLTWFFNRISASDFLAGRKKDGFPQELFWVIKEETMADIVNEKYNNHASEDQKTTPSKYAGAF